MAEAPRNVVARRALLRLAFALGVASVAPSLAAVSTVPVTIGEHGEDTDACPSLGELRTATVLRAGPSPQSPAIATLARGARLHLCIDAADGRWVGVVVAADADDCGVSAAVPRPRRYRGPCRAGWLPVRSLRVIAG